MRPPLAALLLASLLVVSGCLGFAQESRAPSDQQASDALNRTEKALANVSSYRARSNGSAEMTTEGEEETVTLSGRVLVNVSDRELNSTGRLTDSFFPGMNVRRTYVSGYTAITECRLTGWGQRNLSESRAWFEYTPLGEQLGVLNRTPVYWNGTERVNGTQTAVIVAHPTEQELQETRTAWALGAENPEDANFQNATLTMWISTETWRPVQTRRVTNWRTGGADVRLAATWQFEDYDAPTAVTRPPINESRIRFDGC